jgi:hypothetical protein
MFTSTPTDKIAFELENIINDYVLTTGMFVSSGTGYRYKNYAINRLPDYSWEIGIIIDKQFKHIANTFLKISAFTICKLHDKSQLNQINFITGLDDTYRRNHIDACNFKHVIKNSKVSLQVETAEIRYHEVSDRADQAKQTLKKQFLASLVVHIPAEICKK